MRKFAAQVTGKDADMEKVKAQALNHAARAKVLEDHFCKYFAMGYQESLIPGTFTDYAPRA